jgi:hypothetical protein
MMMIIQIDSIHYHFHFIKVMVRVIIITFHLLHLNSTFNSLHFHFTYLRFHPNFIIQHLIIFFVWKILLLYLLLGFDIFGLMLLFFHSIRHVITEFLMHQPLE